MRRRELIDDAQAEGTAIFIDLSMTDSVPL